MSSTEGDILSASFVWKIKDFASLSDKPGDSYGSPKFRCWDALWRFVIYPHGEEDHGDPGYVALYLEMLDINFPKPFLFEISIKREDGTNYMSESTEEELDEGNFNGWSWYVEREELLKDMKKFAPKGALIISCTIACKDRIADDDIETLFPESAASPLKPSSQATLAHNLKDLYLKKDNCDVVIKAQGHELLAHKVILGTRSPVLAAAFAHNMKEGVSGMLEIEDFEPRIVEHFLLYIYSADTEMLSPENVFELYRIADKYDVATLKKECTKFLKSNMTVVTVCDVLSLCKQHDEMELFKFAKNFVAKNAADLLSSDAWKTFSSENLELAHDVLKNIMWENSWKLK